MTFSLVLDDGGCENGVAYITGQFICCFCLCLFVAVAILLLFACLVGLLSSNCIFHFLSASHLWRDFMTKSESTVELLGAASSTSGGIGPSTHSHILLAALAVSMDVASSSQFHRLPHPSGCSSL